jgi:hypothetical protein
MKLEEASLVRSLAVMKPTAKIGRALLQALRSDVFSCISTWSHNPMEQS